MQYFEQLHWKCEEHYKPSTDFSVTTNVATTAWTSKLHLHRKVSPHKVHYFEQMHWKCAEHYEPLTFTPIESVTTKVATTTEPQNSISTENFHHIKCSILSSCIGDNTLLTWIPSDSSSSGSNEINTFPGLMSKWTNFLLWMYFSPLAMWRRIVWSSLSLKQKLNRLTVLKSKTWEFRI